MGVGDWQDEYVALKEEKAQREDMATSFRSGEQTRGKDATLGFFVPASRSLP